MDPVFPCLAKAFWMLPCDITTGFLAGRPLLLPRDDREAAADVEPLLLLLLAPLAPLGGNLIGLKNCQTVKLNRKTQPICMLLICLPGSPAAATPGTPGRRRLSGSDGHHVIVVVAVALRIVSKDDNLTYTSHRLQ